MPPSETAGFDLFYSGLVAARAEPDVVLTPAQLDDLEPGQSWPSSTLRIHGDDVVTALAAATADLRHPIHGTVTVDGHPLASGRLRVQRGYTEAMCGDGCCGGITENSIEVAGVDVLTALEDLHGETHDVRFHGQGYIAPDVDVTFAHHTWDVGPDDVAVKPGDRVVLSLDHVRGLRYRVTAASRDRIDRIIQRESKERSA